MSIELIVSNCSERNVKFENHTERELLTVQLPKARSFTNLLMTNEIAKLAVELQIDFLSYKLIDGYEAIWSSSLDIIECEVELPHRSFPFERRFRNNQDVTEDGKLFIDTHVEGVQAELSEVTNEFNFIDLYKDIGRPRPMMRTDRFERRKSATTSLKITGLNITNHDQALNVIKTIFASICFQIDCKTNLPLMLATERNFSRINAVSSTTDELQLSAVTQKYDSEALSLYWYAQSALGMPLLQYLALYQVVEFYYPIYSELAAQKKVSNALKDPCFNHHDEKDIAKIFNIVKSSSSTRSELSQLESTFKECLDVSVLRDWLKEDTKREEYFRSKNAVKLSEYKINSNADDDDLLRQVWQRFYNIRCRIVHTKGAESELDVLHPQSREIKYLAHDIELANFLAHRVLISSSKPIETV
ncbi:hypothetical protein [Vibrio splendidus]|uniref:Uncharacterized protein n=1 Tax=Vibrio splendidus TaxID=29497 RepID=A0A7Y4FYG7_VIBSP|nr:hypothetical protein [Vibrio splendidus]NOJ12588.1 hypothetical protein [Vibrio splendidus]